MILFCVFCRKNFCGYARVDLDLNYTIYDSHEEDTVSHNKGLSDISAVFVFTL